MEQYMKKIFIVFSPLIVFLINGCAPKIEQRSLGVGEGESFTQLQKACEKNDGKRCATLGLMYMYWGLDHEKAIKYSDKACKLNVAAGCYNLGVQYMIDSRVHESKYYDPTLHNIGYKYIVKGCTMGAITTKGCTKIWGYYPTRTRNMGRAYPYDEFPNDIVKFKKACKINDSAACVKVGIIYYRGLDVKQDFSESAKYFQKACDLNNGFGCLYLGIANLYIGNYFGSFSPDIDWAEQNKLLKRSCDLGIVSYCKIIQLTEDNEKKQNSVDTQTK